MTPVIPNHLKQLTSSLQSSLASSGMSPQELLTEIFTQCGDRAAIGTSGQLTGVVLIDMVCKAGLKPRVFVIDTLRLFPETYQLLDELENRYGIKIERYQPRADKVQEMVKRDGEYLFFDSKEKQELCCKIRKVEPNDEVLKTLDVWITGLRKDQSAQRATGEKIQSITSPDGRNIIKVAPLLDWTEENLRKYIADNGVPSHKLLQDKKEGWFYESLGCVICTTPISEFEPRRAGRWRWFNSLDPSSKECGLHTASTQED